MNAPVLGATRVSLRPVSTADLVWLHAFNALPDVRRSLFDDETWCEDDLTRPGFTETHRSMGNRNPLRHYVCGGEDAGRAT